MERVTRFGQEKYDYLTVFELPNEEGEEWEDHKLLKRCIVANVEVKVAYRRFPANLYVFFGCHGYHLEPELHEHKDRPVRVHAGWFDNAGRQYIRVVIWFDKGYRKATSIFIEQRDGEVYFAPLVSRLTMHRRIAEIKEEAVQIQRKGWQRPYTPRPHRLSAIFKPKDEFYSSTDLDVYFSRPSVVNPSIKTLS